MDFFYYLTDIFHLGDKELSEVLCDHLLQYLFIPQFVESLVPERVDAKNPTKMQLEDRLRFCFFFVSSYRLLIKIIKKKNKKKLSPLLALFLLTQVFYIFDYRPLVTGLAAVLLTSQPELYFPRFVFVCLFFFFWARRRSQISLRLLLKISHICKRMNPSSWPF